MKNSASAKIQMFALYAPGQLSCLGFLWCCAHCRIEEAGKASNTDHLSQRGFRNLPRAQDLGRLCFPHGQGVQIEGPSQPLVIPALITQAGGNLCSLLPWASLCCPSFFPAGKAIPEGNCWKSELWRSNSCLLLYWFTALGKGWTGEEESSEEMNERNNL